MPTNNKKKTKKQYADPPSRRFRVRGASFRQRCGLSVRDVASFLERPEISQTLSPDEIGIYRRWASGNYSREVFATSLGIRDPAFLGQYLNLLERTILQRALLCGVSLRDRKASLTPTDFDNADRWEFEQDQTREAQDREPLADLEGQNKGQDD